MITDWKKRREMEMANAWTPMSPLELVLRSNVVEGAKVGDDRRKGGRLLDLFSV